jgi:GNAT superfamily N-acetyltransferase
MNASELAGIVSAMEKVADARATKKPKSDLHKKVRFEETKNIGYGQHGGKKHVRTYYHGDKEIGFMVYSHHPGTGMHAVEHSKLHPDYRGKGVGKKMYKDLIRDKGKVMSDVSHGTSRAATKTWKRIDKETGGDRVRSIKNPGVVPGTRRKAVVGGGKQDVHVGVGKGHDMGDAHAAAKKIVRRRSALDRAGASPLATGPALGALAAGKGRRLRGAIRGAGWGLAGGVAGAVAGGAAGGARRAHWAPHVGSAVGGAAGGYLGGRSVRKEDEADQKAKRK